MVSFMQPRRKVVEKARAKARRNQGPLAAAEKRTEKAAKEKGKAPTPDQDQREETLRLAKAKARAKKGRRSLIPRFVGDLLQEKKIEGYVPSSFAALARKARNASITILRSASSTRPKRDVTKETVAKTCTSKPKQRQLVKARQKPRPKAKEPEC